MPKQFTYYAKLNVLMLKRNVLIYNFLCKSWLFLPDKCRVVERLIQRADSSWPFGTDFLKTLCQPLAAAVGSSDLGIVSHANFHFLDTRAVLHSLQTSLIKFSQQPARLATFSHTDEGPEAQRDPTVQSHKARDKAWLTGGRPLGLSCLPASLLPTLQRPTTCCLLRRGINLLSHCFFGHLS